MIQATNVAQNTRTGAGALAERERKLGVLAETAFVAKKRVQLLVVDVATLSTLVSACLRRLSFSARRTNESAANRQQNVRVFAAVLARAMLVRHGAIAAFVNDNRY